MSTILEDTPELTDPEPTNPERQCERVVVADEDDASAFALIEGLARHGHEVTHVGTGAGLIGSLKEQPYHNVVLSATLPDIGPEPMCRRLRSFSPTWGLVVALPEPDELETVLCLAAGADDCVSRPYRPREIVARIDAIGRRARHAPPTPRPGPLPRPTGFPDASAGAGAGEGCLRCADLAIDVQRREVRIGESTVELTRKEFDLLVLLVEHRSFVVSREIISERVWNGTWSRRTIDTHVASLRSKLDRPDIIRTVRGVGFKLSA